MAHIRDTAVTVFSTATTLDNSSQNDTISIYG